MAGSARVAGSARWQRHRLRRDPIHKEQGRVVKFSKGQGMTAGHADEVDQLYENMDCSNSAPLQALSPQKNLDINSVSLFYLKQG